MQVTAILFVFPGSNADVYDFQLNDEQMKSLDALDEGKAGSCSWNPVDAP